MSEEQTKDLDGKTTFEERVFARFDMVEGRFDAVDKRFDGIEGRLEKLEARAYDTKPIWERALKEILETRLEVGELNKRVGGLENKHASLTTDFDEFKRELVRQLTRRLDLVLKALVDTRDEMAAAEERITKLESQLA